MANVLQKQITLDGYRNAVVKLTGTIDSSDVIEAPAVALQDFNNNEPLCRLKGFRVDIIEWTMNNNLEINVEWNSSSPQQIFPLSGRGHIKGWNYGGFLPDMTLPGYDGAINIKTANYTPGTLANFTVVLELVKLYSVQ